MGWSSSRTAPAWVPPMGCSPSGTGCSSMGPPQGHKSCQQTCSNMGFPQSHSLFWASTCSGTASFTGCRWISVPTWTSMGCRHTACLAFSMGCRGIAASVPGAPPPPTSSLTLVSAGLFLSHFLTPLSSYNCYRVFFFFFLNILSQRHDDCC